MGKIYEQSLNFYNNWDETSIYNNNIIKKNIKLSVVIPVYHQSYLKNVLEHLSKLNCIYEVVTVFDGKDDNPDLILGDYNFHLTIVQHKNNLNAPAANNTGVSYATGDLILFLDQDMILSPHFIPNALPLLLANNNRAIILGFRDTVDFDEVPTLDNWVEANYENDWRIKTTISDNYLDLTVSCCGSSKNNCGNKTLEIYKESNGFRKLGIKKENTMGFWDLACMVISHTLLIPKKYFLEIGGFPEWIKGWGGEDIALGFLAVAAHIPIIPTLVGSYHINHKPHSGSEEKKWNEMRENLKIYKTWSTTIDTFPVINEKECRSRSDIIYKS